MGLVERERQLTLLGDAVRASGRGSATTVVVAGPPGMGKTELLGAFARGLDEALVLSAAGSRAERGIRFGVLRQLVRHPGLPPAAADLVDRLTQPGRLGGPRSLRLCNHPSTATRRSTARLLDVLCHMLIAEAERRTVVIMIDDAHEADEQSLDAVTYLQRRSRFSRVVLVVSRPTPARERADLDARLTGTVLTVSPLSPAAVGTVAAATLGRRWATEHAAEVHEITGGNPRLVRAVVDDQVAAGHRAARVVLGQGFAHAYLSCLHRLDRATIAVARHLAAQDRRASGLMPPLADLLRSVTPARADQFAHAVTDLEFAGLLRDGRFRHPAARTAVVRSIPSGARDAVRPGLATRRHVVPTQRTADAGLVADARPAVDRVLDGHRSGDAVPAAAHDGPDDPQDYCVRRPSLCAGRGAGVECDTDEEPARRTSQHHPEAVRPSVHLGVAPADAGRRVGPSRSRRRGQPGASAGAPVRVPPARSAAPAAPRAAALGTPCPPHCVEPFSLLVNLVRRHVDGEVLRSGPLPNEAGSRHGLADDAARLVVEADDRRLDGALPEALGLVRTALRMFPAGGWGPALAGPLSVGVAAATAMGRLDDAADLLRTPRTEAVFRTQFGMRLLWSLGQHQMATGQPDRALDTFFRCGQTMIGWGVDLPGLVPWRTGAAEAQIMLGNREAAQALAAMQLKRAGHDAPRVRGAVLRVLAATVLPEERLALLDESVQLLHASGDRVGLAHTLRDVSYAHKLTGSPERARDAAARAIALARACELQPLLQDPLLVEQVDPPRQPTLRVDRLTDAERRVAVLAARGRTNRQISEELFITVSTVEQHLTRVYRKLQVPGRAALAPLLVAQ